MKESMKERIKDIMWIIAEIAILVLVVAIAAAIICVLMWVVGSGLQLVFPAMSSRVANIIVCLVLAVICFAIIKKTY